MLEIKEIREYISLLEQSSLTALELSQGDQRIRLERNVSPAVPIGSAQVIQPMVLSSDVEIPTIQANASEQRKAIESPMVGIFYASPSPGADPFVHVGDHVSRGDVLCIVEAMKLMNEIVAETAGVIMNICVSDGDVVEFGQPLFYIKEEGQ